MEKSNIGVPREMLLKHQRVLGIEAVHAPVVVAMSEGEKVLMAQALINAKQELEEKKSASVGAEGAKKELETELAAVKKEFETEVTALKTEVADLRAEVAGSNFWQFSAPANSA